jgi:hypothetical protein
MRSRLNTAELYRERLNLAHCTGERRSHGVRLFSRSECLNASKKPLIKFSERSAERSAERLNLAHCNRSDAFTAEFTAESV